VAIARKGALECFGIGLLIALVCGYYLVQAITGPLGQLVGLMDVVRKGDFTHRMNIDRRDEFGTLAEGFNRMTDELTALVGQVQRSGIQVNTSVTEIAATARDAAGHGPRKLPPPPRKLAPRQKRSPRPPGSW